MVISDDKSRSEFGGPVQAPCHGQNSKGERSLGQKYLCHVVLFALLVCGCTGSEPEQVSGTTYPTEQRVVETSVVNIPIPISVSIRASLTGGEGSNQTNETASYSSGRPVLQSTFSRVVTGDNALEELWIVPRSSSETSESSLLRRVDEGGNRACGGDFRVASTKFYYGSEATLNFLGISGPALLAVYRCPAQRVNTDDQDVRIIENFTSKYNDAAFFDILTIGSKLSVNEVISVFKNRLEKIGLRVTKIDEKLNGYILIASGSLIADTGAPSEMVMFVQPISGGSKVTWMYLTYRRTFHERGVESAGTFRLGFENDPQPFDRKTAYIRSSKFATWLK